MPKEEAMKQYIAKVDELDPDWMDKIPEEAKDISWFSVSVLAKTEKPIPDYKKTLVNWIHDGNLAKVYKILGDDPELMNVPCEENGMLPIHWAADRGHDQIILVLLGLGADINAQDMEGQTALHYACSIGHEAVIKMLLEHNCKTDITDNDGLLAKDIIDDPEIKAQFHHLL